MQFDKDKLYKILIGIFGGSILLLFILVIVLFIRIRIDEKLINSMEISLANPKLTLDNDLTSAVNNQQGFGKDVNLTGTEAELLIDNNENLSIITEDAKNESQKDDGKRYVYLTFDDGPSSNTKQILKILNEYDVKATFFVNGKQNEELRNLITEISNEGHSIGMHSYSHKYSEVYSSVDAFSEDLEAIEHLIYAQTGVHPTIYRFPGGSSNSVSRGVIGNYIDILSDKNIEYVDWNISSADATGTTSLDPDIIVGNVLDSYKKSDYHTNVVLMHDTDLRDSTVEALPDIIKGLRNMGAVLVPITDNTPAIHHVEK